MARLTPAEITAIAEPLELVYQNMTDELLINIARHLKGGWDDTATWEIKKLGQLGALTEESAKIIAKYTGQTEQEITDAFIEAANLATADIDPALAEAAAAGKLIDPGTTVSTSKAMQSALRSYVEQAQDRLNLTNTTMLASTQQVYAKTVHTAAMTAQLEQAKAIIETQAGEVITGQTARTKAMRTALRQMSAAGIAGFYDRAGRRWQPDAYVNMVIKTTAHNAAIQAIRTRQQEYGGGDVFQVSQHPGARPLCYPYQGKFYSWSGFGVWTDGAGHQHVYEDISVTSYRDPAGLFGINCGHHPIPMIDGFSFPQDQEEQTREENDKEYAESQKQRAIERDIRAAKREQEVYKAAGDEEGAKAAGAKVRREQARMRQFIEETGRPRRYDRESIGGGTTPAAPKATAPIQPAPAPVTWADKIRQIRTEVSGNPTPDQLKKAGEILADEFQKHDDEVVRQNNYRVMELEPSLQAAKQVYDSKLDYLYDLERNPDSTSEQRLAASREMNDARREYFAIKRKYNEAKQYVHGTQGETEKWLRDRIAEVREVGSTGLDVVGHLRKSRSQVRGDIEDAYRLYPREWVEASVNHGTLAVKKVNRGYYSHWQNEIAISGYGHESMRETAIHELGHRFERVVPGLLDQESAFYARRTAGEDLAWLGRGYRRDEKTRFDQFINAYMGKDYRGTAYELVSMGFEYAYAHPDRLAKDADMQTWIYGLLLLQ